MDQRWIYIVTKFPSSTNFYQVFTKLSEADIRYAVRQVALGIQDLHKELIVHRDIKVINVLAKMGPQQQI